MIDDFSRTIGALQSDVSHIRSNTDSTKEKVDVMHEHMIIARRDIKSAHRRLDDIIPHIEDYRKNKHHAAGAYSVLSVISGFIGGVIVWFGKVFFS
jgi:uncharacterized coiled-coil DUF342 family protein